MTVDTTTSRVQENGNGVKTAFTFTFKTLAAADLEVYKVDTVTGISTLQTITTNYTVVLNTVTDGGTVTYVVAPTGTEQSLIIRVMTIDQQTDIPTASNIPEIALEDAYDKSIMISQQIQEQVDRSLVLDVGSTASGITVPAPVADKALIWNSAGDNLTNSTDDYEDQAANAAASAAAALVSEGNAATSATNAATSETNAATSATDAAASAAGVNLPSIISGDATKILEVNTAETGYQLIARKIHIYAGFHATAFAFELPLDGSSVAKTSGGTFNGDEFEAVYTYLYDNLADAQAPVSTGRGANAAADFAANKNLTLPDYRDHALLGVSAGGSITTAGATAGASTVASTGSVGTSGSTAITIAQMPAHDHTVSPFSVSVISNSSTGQVWMQDGGGSVTTSSTGGGTGHNHTGGTYTGSPSSVVQKSAGIFWYITF